MKKLLSAMAIAAAVATAGFTASTTAFAQGADSKADWATKVVALQQGPELDRLVEQLTESTTGTLFQTWGPKLEALPKAKQDQVRDQMNAELKKYADETNAIIGAKVKTVSASVLVPAYMERFTLDELKQIAGFFESPAIQKYQKAAPELGNIFVQQLVEATRPEVQARLKQFDDTAAKLIGSGPATSAPAAKAPAGKAPAKK